MTVYDKISDLSQCVYTDTRRSIIYIHTVTSEQLVASVCYIVLRLDDLSCIMGTPYTQISDEINLACNRCQH